MEPVSPLTAAHYGVKEGCNKDRCQFDIPVHITRIMNIFFTRIEDRSCLRKLFCNSYRVHLELKA